jgi:hypothetical protein
MNPPKRLARPRPARVLAGQPDDAAAARSGEPGRRASGHAAGRPLEVDDREVDSVRESWLIEDRWWTPKPLRRRYWEVVTTCGRDVIVFHDLDRGGWYRHR